MLSCTLALLAALQFPPAYKTAPVVNLVIVVQELTGHPLSGATVTLTRGAAGKKVSTMITSSSGQAEFTNLIADQYYLTTNLSGFFTQVVGPIPIADKSRNPHVPSPLRIAMTPGPVWVDVIEAPTKAKR